MSHFHMRPLPHSPEGHLLQRPVSIGAVLICVRVCHMGEKSKSSSGNTMTRMNFPAPHTNRNGRARNHQPERSPNAVYHSPTRPSDFLITKQLMDARVLFS